MAGRLGMKMWCDVDKKRKCDLCGLFEVSKSGKMECEPVGEIKLPDVPYCSFFIHKNAILEIEKFRLLYKKYHGEFILSEVENG